MATIKDLLSSMISKINSKVSTWEELPDKPFGVKTEMVEIVPEQSVTGTEGSEQYNYHTENKIADFIINKTYTIAINGKQYKCTSVDVDGDGRFIAMGSIDGNVHSDIPFVIAIGLVGGSETEWFTDVVWNTNLGETITLAIYEEQEVVKQLDPKFVGASGGGEFVVKGITDFTESRWEVDKTFAEAYEAYKKGKKIVLEVYADGLPDGEYAMRLTPIYVNSESMQFIIWDFNDKQWDAMRVEFNEGNNMWICSVATIEASVYSMDVS